MSQLSFVSQGGKCEESGEMLCYRTLPEMPLSIMAVRLFGAETVSLGGGRRQTLGGTDLRKDPRVSSSGCEWSRRVKSVPSTAVRERREVKVVSVWACCLSGRYRPSMLLLLNAPQLSLRGPPN